MEDIKEYVEKMRATLAVRREEQNTSDSIKNKCPDCGGVGWITYFESNEYTNEVYGDDREVEYVKRCPRCSGELRLGDLTGIPSQYRNADLSKFSWSVYQDVSRAKSIHKVVSNFFQEFDDWRREGKGLYLWSNTSGTGKTLLACCLGTSLMIRYDIQLRFISVPEYFGLLSEQMKAERGEYDKTKQYKTCDLLILDEIGTSPYKDWYEMKLYQLIDCRMTKGLVTIYTSNSNLEGLKCSDRLADRIGKGCLPLRFPEEPIRKQKNDEQNTEFLRRMGLLD